MTPRCIQCRSPQALCYCSLITPFASTPRFVILIQKREARRSIATGRMTHLSLENSCFYRGTDFTEHEEVNALIADSRNACALLYPGLSAIDLSTCTALQRQSVFPGDKQPVVFLLDATWAQAKRMRRFSLNLQKLPMVSFQPTAPSRFKVRKQPKPHCVSTIEAVHQVIELFGAEPSRPHDGLLRVFDSLVQRQLAYAHRAPRRGQRKTTAGTVSD